MSKQTCGILLITSPTPEHSKSLQEWLNLQSGSFWGVIGRNSDKEKGDRRHPDIPYVRLTDTTLGRNLYFNSNGWLLGVVDEMQWVIEDSMRRLGPDVAHLYERECYSPLLATEGVVYTCYFYNIDKEYRHPFFLVADAVKWVTKEPSGVVTITDRGTKRKKQEFLPPPDGMNITNLVRLKWNIAHKLNTLRSSLGLPPV